MADSAPWGEGLSPKSLQLALTSVRVMVGDAGAEQIALLEQALQELSKWRGLTDPQALHVNLLRGYPAKLTVRSLLHLAGAGECSNAGKCCLG
jgi:hypothetical protein